MPDEQYQFDFGDALRRRYAALERAIALCARTAGDERFDRLQALVAEAGDRLHRIPYPLVDHPLALGLLAETQRAVAAELKRVEKLEEAAAEVAS